MWDVALCSLWKLTLVQNDNNSLRNNYRNIRVCDLDEKHLIVLLLNNLILNDWHLHADTVITIDGEWANISNCSVVRAGYKKYRKGWCLRYNWHCLWMKSTQLTSCCDVLCFQYNCGDLSSIQSYICDGTNTNTTSTFSGEIHSLLKANSNKVYSKNSSSYLYTV